MLFAYLTSHNCTNTPNEPSAPPMPYNRSITHVARFFVMCARRRFRLRQVSCRSPAPQHSPGDAARCVAVDSDPFESTSYADIVRFADAFAEISMYAVAQKEDKGLDKAVEECKCVLALNACTVFCRTRVLTVA